MVSNYINIVLTNLIYISVRQLTKRNEYLTTGGSLTKWRGDVYTVTWSTTGFRIIQWTWPPSLNNCTFIFYFYPFWTPACFSKINISFITTWVPILILSKGQEMMSFLPVAFSVLIDAIISQLYASSKGIFFSKKVHYLKQPYVYSTW